MLLSRGGYGGGMQQVRTFTSSVLEPYERGAEFGALHRGEITRNVAAYRRLFAACATEPFDVGVWSDRAWRTISDLAPAAADEIRGIADGAGLPVAEVAALNARTELLAIADPSGVDECSTVVSLPAGGVPVAVQTWDWYDAMADGWLHWTIPYPDGRVVSTVTEYGVLAKIGVSSSGLGVLFNMLHHTNDAAATDGTGVLGFPVHLLSRLVLETASGVGEAVATAKSVSTSASTSLTLVDPEGGAVSVELFPGGPGLVEATGGVLARTNHFLSDEGREGCLAATIGPGSQIRRTKILAALGPGVPGSADEIIDVMRDHAEVGGICAHPDRSMERVLQHATLATVAIDTAQRSLQVTAGGPCASSLRPSSRT